MSYVTKYEISRDKLEQQFIDPNFTMVPTEKYGGWLEFRAKRLAQASNEFLAGLRASLKGNES